MLKIHLVKALKEKVLYKWSFHHGSDSATADSKVADIYLTYALDRLVNHDPSTRKALDEEREKVAGKVLYSLGMDSFDIAGDQLPWLYVDESNANYVLTRNNTLIECGASQFEYSLDDPDDLEQLRKQLVPVKAKVALFNR